MTTASVVLATMIDPEHGLRIEAMTDSGVTLAFDTPGGGGSPAAVEPTASLLAALAACTSMDVGSILRKKRQRATSYQIEVRAEKANEHPRVFTSISVEHQVSGEVEPEALRRAIELSATRYCPVNAMLSRAVRIEHRYRLRRVGVDDVGALVAVTGPEAVRVV